MQQSHNLFAIQDLMYCNPGLLGEKLWDDYNALHIAAEKGSEEIFDCLMKAYTEYEKFGLSKGIRPKAWKQISL
jgi:hypothetical protein